MRIELQHPEVAFRSCDDCRKWFYDEKTGKPRTSRDGSRLPRLKESTLACVADRCPKGHYSKPIQLSIADRVVLDLYRASRATGGAVLSDEERGDELLMLALGLIDNVVEQARLMQLSQSMAAIALSVKG